MREINRTLHSSSGEVISHILYRHAKFNQIVFNILDSNKNRIKSFSWSNSKQKLNLFHCKNWISELKLQSWSSNIKVKTQGIEWAFLDWYLGKEWMTKIATKQDEPRRMQSVVREFIFDPKKGIDVFFSVFLGVLAMVMVHDYLNFHCTFLGIDELTYFLFIQN